MRKHYNMLKLMKWGSLTTIEILWLWHIQNDDFYVYIFKCEIVYGIKTSQLFVYFTHTTIGKYATSSCKYVTSMNIKNAFKFSMHPQQLKIIACSHWYCRSNNVQNSQRYIQVHPIKCMIFGNFPSLKTWYIGKSKTL